MPKIGCSFLNFFLSMDDFSTCKENTVSLKYAGDMNWSYKDDIDCLLFFFVSSVASLCICFTLSIVNIDIFYSARAESYLGITINTELPCLKLGFPLFK